MQILKLSLKIRILTPDLVKQTLMNFCIISCLSKEAQFTCNMHKKMKITWKNSAFIKFKYNFSFACVQEIKLYLVCENLLNI